MAKARRRARPLTEGTTLHRIVLELDNRVRDIEYCRLENIRFEPDRNSFQFLDGRWVATHSNFPIDADNDLDIMIIITGNPGTQPNLTIRIDNNPSIVRPSNTPVNVNGRAHFNLSIPVTNV